MEVGEAVMELFATRRMPEARMKMFVTLMLKKLDVAKLSHYRLISLCTILYKIHAKVMVEKMKPILSHFNYAE